MQLQYDRIVQKIDGGYANNYAKLGKRKSEIVDSPERGPIDRYFSPLLAEQRANLAELAAILEKKLRIERN